VLPEDVVHTLGAGFAVAVAFSVVTTLHIVLGELAPKSIALQRPEGTSIIVARPTTAFMRLFRPVIYVMNGIGNAVVRLLGFEPASGHERVHSAEELLMLVHTAHEAGVIEDTEEQLLQRVFDFGDIHLSDVMQPRVEVEGIRTLGIRFTGIRWIGWWGCCTPKTCSMPWCTGLSCSRARRRSIWLRFCGLPCFSLKWRV